MTKENLEIFFLFATMIFRTIRVSRWLLTLEHRIKRLEKK